MKISRSRCGTALLACFIASGAGLVACGGSASETPMPLEPLPHRGPELEATQRVENDGDDAATQDPVARDPDQEEPSE